MKLLQVMLSLSLLLILVPLLAVESSSSSSSTSDRNITRGSSLSSNDATPYWFSPSGNIAFGFYKLPSTCSTPNCNDRYVVGIWFVNSPRQTLVWTANPNDLPLHKPSSILFTNDGKLLLRTMPDNKEKPLIPDLQEPASYAKMHDDGNFVLYGSDSQIVWESFDYPTDTILGGQKLRPGVDLISGDYRLSVKQTDGLVVIYRMYAFLNSRYLSERIIEVVSDEIEGSVSTPVTLNLDTSGKLYLVGSDDVALKYLYRHKNQRSGIGKEMEAHMYRATLDSEGHFNLYKERIDGNIKSSDDDDDAKSSSILVQLWPYYAQASDIFFFIIIYLIVAGLCFTGIERWLESRRRKREEERTRGERRETEEGRSGSSGGDLERGETCIEEDEKHKSR